MKSNINENPKANTFSASKKFIFTLFFIAVAHISFAQEDFKNDVIKVIKASGSAAQMEAAKDQIKAMIPEDKFKEFSKDFDATLPSLYESIAKIYMETYSHDDIKAMIKFYDSPIGQKISQNAGSLYKKSMEAGQEWGMQLQGMISKYME